MEDIRPYALMIEECRELYAILSTPHIRVRYYTQLQKNVFFPFVLCNCSIVIIYINAWVSYFLAEPLSFS